MSTALSAGNGACTCVRLKFENVLLSNANGLSKVTHTSTKMIHSDTVVDCTLQVPFEVKAGVPLWNKEPITCFSPQLWT